MQIPMSGAVCLECLCRFPCQGLYALSVCADSHVRGRQWTCASKALTERLTYIPTHFMYVYYQLLKALAERLTYIPTHFTCVYYQLLRVFIGNISQFNSFRPQTRLWAAELQKNGSFIINRLLQSPHDSRGA